MFDHNDSRYDDDVASACETTAALLLTLLRKCAIAHKC